MTRVLVGRELLGQLAVPVAIQDVTVLLPEQVNIAGHLDVVSTVLLDQVDAPFLPPLQRLQAVGALADPQSRLRQVAQLQTEPELAVNVGEYVEGADARQVPRRVSLQDGDVESIDVVTNDPVGHRQVEQKPIDVLLVVRLELGGDLVVRDRQRQFHVGDVLPPADLLRAPLRLDVENERQLARRRQSRGRAPDRGRHGLVLVAPTHEPRWRRGRGDFRP